MQRTVGRHIRSIDEEALTHLDRVLLPILQRLARARPPEAGPVHKRLWHLVVRWNDRVLSQRHPDIPASTNRLEGWFGRPSLGSA